MQTQPDRGSYSRSIIHLRGSFQTNGASAATVLRDGKSALIKSVTRNSAGNYTVVLNDYGTIPSRLIDGFATIQSAAAPTKVCQAHIVKSTYSQSTRSFQIQIIKTGTVGGAAAAPVVDDPDTGDRIGFHLVGSLSSAGTDAA